MRSTLEKRLVAVRKQLKKEILEIQKNFLEDKGLVRRASELIEEHRIQKAIMKRTGTDCLTIIDRLVDLQMSLSNLDDIFRRDRIRSGK